MESKAQHNTTNPITNCLTLHDSDTDYYFIHEDIVSIQASDTYVTIHTLPQSIHQKEVIISKGLGKIEKCLPPEYFIRIHRSWIVNLMYVCKHSKKNGHRLIMTNQQSLPVSGKRLKAVLAEIDRFRSTVP